MKVLNNSTEIEERCICKKNQCTLNGKCLTWNIIYKAHITSNTKSFNLEHYENNMKLSKEYCLKNKVTWRIIRKCATFNTNKRKCYVFQQKAWNCFIQRRQFTEQFFIIFSWDATIFRLKIAVRFETLSLKTQYFHFSNI